MATVTAAPLADPQQIQGNILRPFGGTYQAFVFVSFRSDRTNARRWLRGVAARAAGTDDVRARSGDDPMWSLMNVGLTAPGLFLLHPETAGPLSGFDAFWRGPLGTRLDDAGRLTTAPALLGDVGRADPANWVVGGPGGPPVDALITVAADDEKAFADAVAREENAIAAAELQVLRVDRGGLILDGDRRIEHFGFADGLSQPGIRGFHDPEHARPGSPIIAAGEFILGYPGERRPQSWTPRPAAARWMRGGSFQVFRRLRQDVVGWWDRMAELGGRDGTPEDAAAHALGRKLDGTPLTPDAAPATNDFDFGDDELGTHTPLNAHIRKMNPRENDVFRERGHKILRRGIPYGPKFHRGTTDEQERGLLFNGYMASIEDQFEFLQRRWANDPEFPATTLSRYGREPAGKRRVDGLDPVLGMDRETARERLPKAVFDQLKPTSFGGFVTTTGAVYAFAPPRPTLDLLAGDEPLD